MTLVSLPSPIAWPGILGNITGAPSLATAVTVSAAGHYMAYIFVAKEDMVVSHVGFRAGTATGSPTIEVRIETLDASGFPSGTLWAVNTNGTTGTVSTGTNVLQALTASATITKGQPFCVKIAYASGTSQIIQHLTGLPGVFQASMPYQVSNTGTPTKAILTAMPTIALGSSSTTFYQVPGCIPASTFTNNTFNNTNSAKRGLLFTPPMACRVIGLRWWNSNSTGDYNAAIYSSASGSAVELSSSSTAFDGDFNAAALTAAITVYFDNPVTLSAGTSYRAALEPSSATNINISTIQLPSVNHRSASPAGTTALYTTFASGAWTDSATDTIPLLDILIDQVDDGSGTGGIVGVVGG